MATITKRGKNQWQAKIRRKGWDPQHKTFETKADADAWAREIEGEMDRGMFMSRKEAETTTLREALERFKQEYVPRYSHPEKEITRINHILTYPIASRFLASIRGKDLADFVKLRQEEGVGPNTIRLDLAIISKLYGVSASDWGMESLSNPASKVSKPKLPPGRDRRLMTAVFVDGEVISEEELLIRHATKRLKAIIPFAIETAMRREEIALLTWDRVNFRTRTAYLNRTKNGKQRTVPLSPRAIEILESILPKERTILNCRVFLLSKERITKQFVETTKKAKITNLRFHDLRHEATSRLFEKTDLDIMEIRGITGHESLEMLKRYSHLRAHTLADRLAGKRRGA